MFNVNREYISKKRVIYNLYGRERANKMVEVKELIKNTEEYINKEVTVGGWVRSIRDSKTFGFIVLNDGTFFQPVQVVYNDKMNNFQEVSKVNIGAALIVKGILVETPNAKQPLKFRQMKFLLKEKAHLIIHYKKRDILSSTLEQFHI